MDKNIFIHFITIFYSKSRAMRTPKDEFLFFTKLRPTPYGLACFPLANLITKNGHELF